MLQPNRPVYSLSGTPLAVSLRNDTLWNMGRCVQDAPYRTTSVERLSLRSSLVAKARQLAALPLATFTHSEPNTYYILRNALGAHVCAMRLVVVCSPACR